MYNFCLFGVQYKNKEQKKVTAWYMHFASGFRSFRASLNFERLWELSILTSHVSTHFNSHFNLFWFKYFTIIHKSSQFNWLSELAPTLSKNTTLLFLSSSLLKKNSPWTFWRISCLFWSGSSVKQWGWFSKSSHLTNWNA